LGTGHRLVTGWWPGCSMECAHSGPEKYLASPAVAAATYLTMHNFICMKQILNG